MQCPTPWKDRYQTYKDAKWAAEGIARSGKKLYPYGCACGVFHLTKKEHSSLVKRTRRRNEILPEEYR